MALLLLCNCYRYIYKDIPSLWLGAETNYPSEEAYYDSYGRGPGSEGREPPVSELRGSFRLLEVGG